MLNSDSSVRMGGAALLAAALPGMIEQMDEGLEQQQRSLGELSEGIDEVSESLPEMGQSAARLLLTTRWLLGVVALAVALHGGYLLLSQQRRHDLCAFDLVWQEGRERWDEGRSSRPSFKGTKARAGAPGASKISCPVLPRRP